jgi:hypothetical protein
MWDFFQKKYGKTGVLDFYGWVLSVKVEEVKVYIISFYLLEIGFLICQKNLRYNITNNILYC